MSIFGIFFILFGVFILLIFFWFRRHKENVDKSRKIFSYIADIKMIIGGISLIIVGLIMLLK